MEKKFNILNLLDIYGQLLTKRQREIMSSYYEYDLSKAEIALNLNISRQAVLDSVSKSEKTLLDYEKMLKLQHIKQQIDTAININDEKQRLDILKNLLNIL